MSEPKAQSAVVSSELVGLLVRWNDDVIKWERAAERAWNDDVIKWERAAERAADDPQCHDRCRARANEIARCRRELAEVIKQHSTL